MILKHWIQSLFVALAILAGICPTEALTIFPVATNGAISQISISLAFGGTNYLVGIQGDAVASNDITAQLVSPNGNLVGSRIAIGRTGTAPKVSFDGANFFVLWPDDALYPTNVIYGQFVSQSGALVGSPMSISNPDTNADFGSLQSVASGGQNYLAIWTDASGPDAPNSDAYYALFSPNGFRVVPGTLLGTNAYEPGVVFGRTNYLAFWQNQRPTGPELYDTCGAFISTNGVPGASFVISQTPSPAYNPLAAAFDGTNFLVVWNKDISPGYPSPTEWNFYGRLVSANGIFPGNEVALVTDTNGPVFPFLGFDGANYLMTWTAGILGTTNTQIYFQFLDQSPAPAGPEFTLFSPQGTNAPFFGSIACGNGQLAAIGVLGGLRSRSFRGFTSGTATYGTIIPSSTVPPRFDMGAQYANKQFTLSLAGTPGVNYSIQMSTNLAPANWASIETGSPTNGTFTVTDTSATNRSRFYRAVKK
jgi:hypothetical protein